VKTTQEDGRNDPGATDRRLLSISEAASRVGLKHLAIRRAIHRGELPALKLCSRIRIEVADLEVWLERSRITVTRPDAVARPGEFEATPEEVPDE
jgi:excisionase family DNA binding protein